MGIWRTPIRVQKMQENQEVTRVQQGLATAAQAVVFLNVSRTTLWRLQRQGILTHVKIGRALRFRWADLECLAKQGGEQ